MNSPKLKRYRTKLKRYRTKVECSWPESFPSASYVREYTVKARDEQHALELAEDKASSDQCFNEGAPEQVVCLEAVTL